MFIKNDNNIKNNEIKFFNKLKLKNFYNNFDYSEVKYINNRTNIKIKCLIHDEFFYQTPYEHLKGYKSCQYCKSNKKMTTDEFIEKANKVHNYKFDYSLVDYTGNKIKVKIICKKHGIFEQAPNWHLNGNGCDLCRVEYKEKFIEKSSKIHNNKYDYSDINYINNSTKIKIICPEHGVFYQKPQHHLKGIGCTYCNKSKGELIIANILKKLNIKFEQEKIFIDCKDKKELPFDFYLIDFNCCIEFDGRHHYESINYWGGDNKLKYTKNHDFIKNNYCKNNNIKLVRIKFDNSYKDIEKIIEKISL